MGEITNAATVAAFDRGGTAITWDGIICCLALRPVLCLPAVGPGHTSFREPLFWCSGLALVKQRLPERQA